jgi:hypothetical protein
LKGKKHYPPVHHPWETSVVDEKQVNYELVNLSYFLLTLPWQLPREISEVVY